MERGLAGEVEHRPGRDLRLVRLGLVGDVLAEAGRAAALERDHGRDALEPGGHGAGQALQRIALDVERECGDRLVERHGRGRYPPRPHGRCARALSADRGGGPAGRAARRTRARAAAGRGARLREGARAAAGDVAGVDGGRAAHRAVRHAADRRRAGAAGDRGRARRPPAAGRRRATGGGRLAAPDGAAAAARAARGPGAPAAVLGRRGGVRGDVRARRAAGVVRARRVEHREADGHGVHQRAERVRPLPAARPVDERRDAQLLLPRAPRDGVADPAARAAAGLRLPAGLGADCWA